MRNTRYREHRPRAIDDSYGNGDYLVLHPKIGFLRELLGRHRPRRVVDVGCGSKKFESVVREICPEAEYVGLDVEDNKEGTVDILIAGAHELPLESSSVDFIICNQVLEHVEGPLEALREFERVLKPGSGCLFLAAPLLEQEHEQPYDFFRYTQFGLRHLLGRSGFREEDLEIRPLSGALGAFGQLFINFLAMTPAASAGPFLLLFRRVFLRRPALRVFNALLSGLDRLRPYPNPTIGYVVAARKRP